MQVGWTRAFGNHLRSAICVAYMGVRPKANVIAKTLRHFYYKWLFSTLSFLVAFTLSCMTKSNTLTRSLVCAAWLAVFWLLLWYVLLSWIRGDAWWWHFLVKVWVWTCQRLACLSKLPEQAQEPEKEEGQGPHEEERNQMRQCFDRLLRRHPKRQRPLQVERAQTPPEEQRDQDRNDGSSEEKMPVIVRGPTVANLNGPSYV
jgi:hypothetical protein